MSEDPIANWMRRMIEANLEAMRRLNSNVMLFTFTPPPLGPNIGQTSNSCPADCPMYRRSRGCMTTRCVKTREQNMVEPAKIGEQPKDE